MRERMALVIGVLILTFSLVFFPRVSTDESAYNFPKVEGMFNFVVHVSSKAGICTGTILNPKWIITAAHCFFFRDKIIGDNDARIKAGIVNYEYPRAQTNQDTMSDQIKVHPRFWENRMAKFDIALVKLRDKLEFGKFVGSIKIAGDQWPQENNQSANCMTLGFGGYRSTAPATADLKSWNVTALHGADACPCARRFQYKRLVCVKEAQYSMICQGDDGGPLVCGNVVRAIVHMVWNRYTCDKPLYPLHKCVGSPEKGLSTYMFLCPFNAWINEIVPNTTEVPASCRASLVSYCLTTLLASVIISKFLFV